MGSVWRLILRWHVMKPAVEGIDLIGVVRFLGRRR